MEGIVASLGITTPVVSFDNDSGDVAGGARGHGGTNGTGEEAISKAVPAVPPAGAAAVKQDGGLAAQAGAQAGETVRTMSPVMMVQLAFAAGHAIENNNDDKDYDEASTGTGGEESVLPLEDLEDDKSVDLSAFTEVGSAGGGDDDDGEYLDEYDDTMMRMEAIDVGTELAEEEVAEGRGKSSSSN